MVGCLIFHWWLRNGKVIFQACGAVATLAVATVSPATETVPADLTAATKMQFPDGTATPSEHCGACHVALYKEFTEGTGTDLNWAAMKFNPSSKKLLSFDEGTSKAATAHHVAGTDPWPHEAKRVESDGKECNVCHFPEPMAYPDDAAREIQNPTPRAAHRELGI